VRLLFCKLLQTANPATLIYPVKSALPHRWGNSALGVGSWGHLTRFLFFTADVGGYTRMDADEELLFDELF
jgi:hypothetical protein